MKSKRREKCPFCGGTMTPVYNGNVKTNIIASWECSRSSCQFHPEYFGGDGLEHRNMKKILKMKKRITELEERLEIKDEYYARAKTSVVISNSTQLLED